MFRSCPRIIAVVSPNTLWASSPACRHRSMAAGPADTGSREIKTEIQRPPHGGGGLSQQLACRRGAVLDHDPARHATCGALQEGRRRDGHAAPAGPECACRSPFFPSCIAPFSRKLAASGAACCNCFEQKQRSVGSWSLTPIHSLPPRTLRWQDRWRGCSRWLAAPVVLEAPGLIPSTRSAGEPPTPARQHSVGTRRFVI